MPDVAGDRGRAERRRYVIAGLVMLTAILAMAVAAGLLADDPAPLDDVEQTDRSRPRIVPEPGAGEAPDDSGDRGGWQQLVVLAAMVAGIALLGGLAWRSSVRTRRPQAVRVAGQGSAPPTRRSDSTHS